MFEYQALTEHGICTLIKKVCTMTFMNILVNVHGDEVCEDDIFGRKVTHKMTNPSYVVFVDEVGSNTSMEGDGHVGGEFFIMGTQVRQIVTLLSGALLQSLWSLQCVLLCLKVKS
jgi:hypothetical protein